MQNPKKTITIVIAALNKGGYSQREQLAPTSKTNATTPAKTLQIGHLRSFQVSEFLNGTFITILSPFQNSSWGTEK
jgi:hypothetical protein